MVLLNIEYNAVVTSNVAFTAVELDDNIVPGKGHNSSNLVRCSPHSGKLASSVEKINE